MGLPLTLTADDRKAIEESFVVDPTGGPRWPITVAPSFVKGLKEVDPRLELRWMPRHGCFGVFMRMSRERYWRTPVHSIHNGRDPQTQQIRFRPPSETDLTAIRKAKYMMATRGSEHKIEEMNRELDRQERIGQEWREKETQKFADKMCSKYEVTTRSFGVERGGSVRPNKVGPKTARI